MLTVRQASAADIQIIREIAYKTWPSAYGSILSFAQLDYMLQLIYSEAALRKQIKELSHSFLLAYDDDNVQGFASYGFKSTTDSEIMRLHKLYVLPEAQKFGIGQLLLDRVVAKAQSAGAVRLSLNVNRDNVAKNFYEKNGFAVIGEEDIDIGSGFFMNDFIMEKKLG